MTSGYIDWHRLAKTKPWTDTGDGSTFVYAFWLADYGTSQKDHGVSLLKAEGEHPDWFLHGELAETVIFSVLSDELIASPNVEQVYFLSEYPHAKPLLAAMCLGTAKATYSHPDNHYWWCKLKDLTRPGRRMVMDLSTLYLRPPVIVTFLELEPMEQAVPEAEVDTATVTQASGHTD